MARHSITRPSRIVALGATLALTVGALPALAADAPTACPDGEVPSAGFTDTAGTVHEENIDCIAYYGITSGTTPTTYSPSLSVTRAQMATFMARTIELARPLPTPSDQGFDDIAGTAHEDRINQLAAIGVTTGVDNDTFGPNLTISRGQMAVFLVRGWKAATGDALVREGPRHFNDTDGTAFADSIDIAFEMGWTLGDGNDQYGPGLPVSRAAMGSFLARFLEDLVAAGAAQNKVDPDPALTSFTITDGDDSEDLSNGDVLRLTFNQAMQADSSITLQDADGDQTIVDDQVAVGVTDGRTAATLTGNGTSTLVFTLQEDPDVTGAGDGVLNGVIAIVDAEGISNGDVTWVPADDAPTGSTITVVTDPADDTTAPAAPTIAFGVSTITSANVRKVPVSGTAEPGSTITISVDDTAPATPTDVTTTVTQISGSWSTTVDLATPVALVDGPITATATATDAGKNVSPKSAVANATLDTQPPTIAITTITPSPINSLSASSVTVSGTASPSSKIDVRLQNNLDNTKASPAGTVTATSGGTWTASIPWAGVKDGPLSARATATDAAGNRSDEVAKNVLKDTVAPGAPTLGSVESPVGPANADAMTVTGTRQTATDAVDVVVSDGTTDVTATVPSGSATNWSIDVDLTDGAGNVRVDGDTLSVTATSRDAAGNPSGEVTADAELDLVAPTFNSAGKTGENVATFTASEPLDASTVDTDPSGGYEDFQRSFMVPALATVSYADGVITLQFAGPLPDAGTITLLDGAVTDALGNTNDGPVQHFISQVTQPFDIEFGPINLGNVNSATISGMGDQGDEVNVSVSGPGHAAVNLGPATVNGDGVWTISGISQLAGFTDGTLTASITATDGENTSNTTTANAVKDTVRPTFTSSGGPGATQIRFTATEPLAPGSIDTDSAGGFDDITLSIPEGDAGINSVVYDNPTRRITVNLKNPARAGQTITLLAPGVTDANGNAGAANVVHAIPSPTKPTIAWDAAQYNAEDAQTAELSGTSDPNANLTVTIVDVPPSGPANTKTVTTPADGSGAWSIVVDLTTEPTLRDGTLTATAVASIGPDNSAPSNAVTALLDTTAPTAPTVAFQEGKIGPNNDDAVGLSGTTSEPGLVVTVTVDDTNPATAAVTATPTASTTNTGTAEAPKYAWSVTVDTSGLGDVLTATARATDAVGNESGPGTDTVTKDGDPPTFMVASDDNVVITFTSNEPLDPASVDTNSTGGFADFSLNVAPTSTNSIVGVSYAASATEGLITVTLSEPLGPLESITLRVGAVTDTVGNANQQPATHPTVGP